jgi:hypothetical protein
MGYLMLGREFKSYYFNNMCYLQNGISNNLVSDSNFDYYNASTNTILKSISDDYNIFTNLADSGPDMLTISNVKDPSVCKKSCSLFPNCIGFNYDVNTSICHLKTQLSILNSSSMSYYNQIKNSNYDVVNNQDYVNLNYNSIILPDTLPGKSCSNICDNIPSCKGYILEKSNKCRFNTGDDTNMGSPFYFMNNNDTF